MALELESETDANFYFEVQKSFLMRLFSLFLATKKPFTFEDIVQFISYDECRSYTYTIAKEQGGKEHVDAMIKFLESLKKGYPELLGLLNIIDQLFVSDPTISKLVNVTSVR